MKTLALVCALAVLVPGCAPSAQRSGSAPQPAAVAVAAAAPKRAHAPAIGMCTDVPVDPPPCQ
jgi:hypothetical protein